MIENLENRDYGGGNLLIVVIVGLYAVLAWYKKRIPIWRSEYLSLLLFGGGLVLLSWPVLLSYFLGIDTYRLWIIQGPDPFDKMGGGPYMLGKYIGWMIIGFGLIVWSLQVKLRSINANKKGDS